MAFQDKLLLRGVKVSVFSPKSILLDTRRTAIIELKDEHGNLKGLISGGETLVTVGENIVVNKEDTLLETLKEGGTTVCPVHSIFKGAPTQEFPYTYELLMFPHTLSSLFLMPLTGIPNLSKIHSSYFINCYAAYNMLESSNKYIYLLCRYNYMLAEHEDDITRTPGYAQRFDIHPEFVLYQFMLPEKYRNDYDLFMKSKYSSMSKDAKERILQFHRFRRDGTMAGILYKTDEARKKLEKSLSTNCHKVRISDTAELYSCIDVANETLKMEVFNELTEASTR